MSVTQSTRPQPKLEHAEPSEHPPGLPRLLAGIADHRAMSLQRHHATHGPLPLAHGRRGRAGRLELIDELAHAGLRGRGGAAFATATKMRAVAASRGRPVVLINAAESEPASRKDRTLTHALPHLVLDGAELAARALDAKELIVGVCESARSSADSLAVALAERESARGAPRMRVLSVPDRYVAGQETALVSHASGGPAMPTFTPPMPFQRGVAGRPTLVANAETLAHVALIARHGARWFRRLGTAEQPGSALVTLSGTVARPGVYEIAIGESLAGLVDAAGGLTTRPLGVLLGGYGGSWVAAEHLHDLLLADEQLAPYGASLGAGVVALLSENACPAAETARLARWLAGHSAGQCGPCVHGLDALATSVREIVGGAAGEGSGQRVARLAALARGRGACGHPDGATRMVLSALDAFAPEFADHARHGPCDRCRLAPELPLPSP
jgi:NADH:ubiquinone oxidoreductase subunit F (NADH-binding)